MGSEKMSLGKEIAVQRKKLGLSQENFANKLNVARQTVSSWEHDIYIPDGKSLIGISELLGCRIDDLLNPPQPPAPDERERSREPGAVADAEGKPAA
jgi:transcriptional regulator with XRE-family HTH domain